ncbi:MAG: porin family protein [Candidatus Krumholzibacteria bacterium]|nr:porin family protein [Candidatus Krumholzibacteria bacterium]
MTHRKSDHKSQPLKTAVLIITTLALALPVTKAHAQKEDRSRGFYLGIKFIGSSLHVDEDGESDFFVKDDGGGIQFHAGYSFNRVFSLELAFGGANHETSVQSIDADFGLFQLCVHYRFSPGRAFRPYIKGGLGGYGLVLKDNNKSVRIDGGGVPIGGGFDYFFSKHFSLGVDLTHNIISYDKVKVDFGTPTDGLDIDQAGAMTSLGLALAYYF